MPNIANPHSFPITSLQPIICDLYHASLVVQSAFLRNSVIASIASIALASDPFTHFEK